MMMVLFIFKKEMREGLIELHFISLSYSNSSGVARKEKDR